MILGIDPGLENTGWAVLDEDQKLVDFGVIKTGVKAVSARRLRIIHDELTKLIKTHDIKVVVMESLYFAKNAKSALKVAEAIGVLKLAACENLAEIVEFTPMEVKMALVGYGRAEKEQVEIMVRQALSLEEPINPNHAADAAAVGLTYCFTRKIR